MLINFVLRTKAQKGALETSACYAEGQEGSEGSEGLRLEGAGYAPFTPCAPYTPSIRFGCA